MRKRPIKISLRLNEQEHEHLKQQAMLSGFPMEVFLRAPTTKSRARSLLSQGCAPVFVISRFWDASIEILLVDTAFYGIIIL